MQNLNDHDAHDNMQQPFVRIHDHRRDTDICNGKGSQDQVSSSGFSYGFSVAVGFMTAIYGISVETDDVVVSRSTHPKDPSRISNKEDILVPARTILILPRPSWQSCRAFLSKWEVNSGKCKP